MVDPFENTEDHDRYLRKNMALSRAYDIEKKDKQKHKEAKGELKPIVHKCHRCKQEKPCLPFLIMETGFYDGATSVSKEMVQLCDECSPKKKKQQSEMTKKQIKSLLRGARRGRF